MSRRKQAISSVRRKLRGRDLRTLVHLKPADLTNFRNRVRQKAMAGRNRLRTKTRKSHHKRDVPTGEDTLPENTARARIPARKPTTSYALTAMPPIRVRDFATNKGEAAYAPHLEAPSARKASKGITWQDRSARSEALSASEEVATQSQSQSTEEAHLPSQTANSMDLNLLNPFEDGSIRDDVSETTDTASLIGYEADGLTSSLQGLVNCCTILEAC